MVLLAFDGVEAIEVLIGLETMAAEPACEFITDAEIAEVEKLHADMVQAHHDGELMTYFVLNQAIHQRLVDAARNPVLSRIYAAECARIRRYRYADNRKNERWQEAVREHEHILAALRQRAGAMLREILRQHHRSGWAVSRKVLEQELGAVGDAAAEPKRTRKARSASTA